MQWLYFQNKYYVLNLQKGINLIWCYFNNNNKFIFIKFDIQLSAKLLLKIIFLKYTLQALSYAFSIYIIKQ